MSTKTYDSALDFMPERKRVAQGGFLRGILAGLAAIREGIDCAGEYKELTNRGMPSDAAARKVFDKIGRN